MIYRLVFCGQAEEKVVEEDSAAAEDSHAEADTQDDVTADDAAPEQTVDIPEPDQLPGGQCAKNSNHIIVYTV